MMRTHLIKIIFIALIVVQFSYAWFEYCDHVIPLNQNIYVSSPNYPNNYNPGSSCRYQIIAPLDHQINIECNVKLDKGGSTCGTEYFYISTDGDRELRGSEYICGSGYVQRKSLFNKMTIAYTSSSLYNSGSFSCYVTYERQPCDCGQSMNQRIVGGVETKITEFPFMAAIVNSNGMAYCGGSTISHRVILTAAHCIVAFPPVYVIVGDHDLKTSGETPYTQKHYVLETRKHEAYNGENNANDIALVVTQTTIEWSLGVGPVCLPLLYVYASFQGFKADLAGWGTTSLGGPSSTVLLKTTVDIVENAVCDRYYKDMTSWKMCSFTYWHDSCQYDSGGPVIWRSKRMQLIGLISYGKDCGYTPGVNTRITAYLDWIQRNTGETYCRKA